MRKSHWIVFGSVVCVSAGTAVLWGAGEGDPPQLTQIEDIVMYGIDVGTHELLRYEFGSDGYLPIGVVKDQNDNCPWHANPGQFDSDGDGFGDACDPQFPACETCVNPNNGKLIDLCVNAQACIDQGL